MVRVFFKSGPSLLQKWSEFTWYEFTGTLINRTYFKFPWFNIELVNLRKLLCRLQRKYTSFKLESDIISFNVFARFTRKNFSTKSSYFTDMLCSYGISSKQAYQLSFTLVGKPRPSIFLTKLIYLFVHCLAISSNNKFLALSIYSQTSTRHDSISI